jgi:hypothetical protein
LIPLIGEFHFMTEPTRERAELGMNQLATATVERIRRALARFGGTPPFIIPTKSVWGTDRSVTQPFTVQTTQQDKAVVSAAIIKNNGPLQEAKDRASSPATTLGALTTSPAQALATAAIVPQRFESNPSSAHGQRSHRHNQTERFNARLRNPGRCRKYL